MFWNFFFRFYLATLEAALEHVTSGELSKIDLEAPHPQVSKRGVCTHTRPYESSISNGICNSFKLESRLTLLSMLTYTHCNGYLKTCCSSSLGPIYTKRQRQRCNTGLIAINGVAVNRLQTHSSMTPWISSHCRADSLLTLSVSGFFWAKIKVLHSNKRA